MDTELLVLGSGPAGYYCALEAARAGFLTALAEKAELGGTGFRWGCLPVKMGLDALRQGRPSLPSPLRMAEVERRLEEGLRAAGVTLLRGEASFLDARTLAVGGRRVRAETVVIATGTRPAAPEGLALDGERVLSHADLVRRGRASRRPWPRGEARLRRVARWWAWPAGRSSPWSACCSPAGARPTCRPACTRPAWPAPRTASRWTSASGPASPTSMPSAISTACAGWPTPPSSKACCCRGRCA